MIDFMVIGLPRSGTTWAANWLTTDNTLCLHDPLWQTHYRDLDAIESGSKAVGVACTGLFKFTGFLNDHPAKKVILHRSLPEINRSLAAIGLPACTPYDVAALNKIAGLHYDYADLFDLSAAATMFRYLTGRAMDWDRHTELCKIEMQPKFSGLKVGADVTRRLVEEMTAALK